MVTRTDASRETKTSVELQHREGYNQRVGKKSIPGGNQPGFKILGGRNLDSVFVQNFPSAKKSKEDQSDTKVDKEVKIFGASRCMYKNCKMSIDYANRPEFNIFLSRRRDFRPTVIVVGCFLPCFS